MRDLRELLGWLSPNGWTWSIQAKGHVQESVTRAGRHAVRQAPREGLTGVAQASAASSHDLGIRACTLMAAYSRGVKAAGAAPEELAAAMAVIPASHTKGLHDSSATLPSASLSCLFVVQK